MNDFDTVEEDDAANETVADLDAEAGVLSPDEEEQAIGEHKERSRLTIALRMHDGQTLKGELGVGSNQRLSDYLNGSKDFWVVLDAKGKAHIINKRYVVSVVEI